MAGILPIVIIQLIANATGFRQKNEATVANLGQTGMSAKTKRVAVMCPIQHPVFLGVFMGKKKINKRLSPADKVRRSHIHLDFLSRCKRD